MKNLIDRVKNILADHKIFSEDAEQIVAAVQRKVGEIGDSPDIPSIYRDVDERIHFLLGDVMGSRICTFVNSAIYDFLVAWENDKVDIPLPATSSPKEIVDLAINACEAMMYKGEVGSDDALKTFSYIKKILYCIRERKLVERNCDRYRTPKALRDAFENKFLVDYQDAPQGFSEWVLEEVGP